MLGQAVDSALLQVRRPVLVAVPFRIGRHVAQTEVGGHVDHLHGLRQAGDDLLGGAMGQPADDHVAVRPVGLLHLDQVRQRIAAQMRENVRDRLAGMAVRRHQRNLGLGVGDQKPIRSAPV